MPTENRVRTYTVAELERLATDYLAQHFEEAKGDIARGSQRGHCYCPRLNRRSGQICICPRFSSLPPRIAMSPLGFLPFGLPLSEARHDVAGVEDAGTAPFSGSVSSGRFSSLIRR